MSPSSSTIPEQVFDPSGNIGMRYTFVESGDLANSSGWSADPLRGDGSSGETPLDPGEYLRLKLNLQIGEPINLWSLPDPEPGARPPHSYPLLVRLAIYGSPNKRMTLKEIYAAIEERFEWYKKQPKNAPWRVCASLISGMFSLLIL